MPQSNPFTTDSTKTLSKIMSKPTQSEPNQQPNPKKAKPTNNDKLIKILDKQTKNTQPKLDNESFHPKKVEKEKKILKILKYLNSKRFGAKLKSELGIKYTRQQLLKCSNDNLDAILFRIRNYLNTRNMDMVFEQMAKYTAKGYEDLVSNFYDIEGFSDLLMQNPAFWDAFERWKIEHEMPDIPPSMQMVYIIASTTYIAHLQRQIGYKNNVAMQKDTSNNKKDVPNNNKQDTSKNKKDKKDVPKLNVGDVL